ncbi:MAG TPA: HAD-IIIA family hydrolase, partial [Solirubrobacteraceae bacterium]|nr:HAD-IIIA family hydrolase [Solirubrobacteraceae bacterium]
RPGADGAPLEVPAGVEVVRGRADGPAAARNVGWRAATAEWVAFLDDDVLVTADWAERLAEDLREGVDASQGRIEVPVPSGRAPTDWERNVQGLEGAAWATADMAYRRTVLASLGGFDERFPRAYREDADLAVRAITAGRTLARGSRTIHHPVRPAAWHVSVKLQRGNADDALMRAIHGADWRAKADAPRGRLRRSATTTAVGASALAFAAAGRPRAAALLGAAWLAETATFAWQRIAPGPRTPDEILKMVATSALIPPVATFHRAKGEARVRRAGGAKPWAPAPAPAVDAVLFDRDGTLVIDVPYNGDPAKVELVPGAREAVAKLRDAGIPLAVISNQSGVARGMITEDQVHAVNARVDELVGGLGPWLYCPHGPDDDCACRKPAPGLVLRAAEQLGVKPERCAVIGDIGADVQAARAAGARGVLVPTPITRAEEIEDAPEVAPDLLSAVDLLLGGARA